MYSDTCVLTSEVMLWQVNGHPIKQFTIFGKPHPEPYRLVEKLLVQQAKLTGLDLSTAGNKLPFGAVYAVGDNPASDIAGARAAGESFANYIGCAASVCTIINFWLLAW